jgi:uncharacterized protein YjbJ (UPF0337 family)
MNWDRIEGQWKTVQGKLRAKWGKLTDDDLETTKGKRDQIVGKLQARYGEKKDALERQLDDFVKTL